MTTPEANPADLVEQAEPATPDAAVDDLPAVPLEAPEADAAEQARVVELDEEEYR